MGKIIEVGLSDGLRMKDNTHANRNIRRIPREFLSKTFKNYKEQDVIFFYSIGDGKQLALRDSDVLLAAIESSEESGGIFLFIDMDLDEKTKLVLVSRDARPTDN